MEYKIHLGPKILNLPGPASTGSNAVKHKGMNDDTCLLSNNAVQISPASQSELLHHYIRETSDAELEALAAHASFYLHRLDVQTMSGLAFAQAALLTAKYRRPRPDDLSSPMAFKFHLKGIIRLLIDSIAQLRQGRSEGQALAKFRRKLYWELSRGIPASQLPELLHWREQFPRFVQPAGTRRQRQELRRSIRDACRRLGEEFKITQNKKSEINAG